ncbi:hypothetical protein D0851_18440 [Marinobacter sp. Arc7-DN-1]|nr:hypothetical protein D0851_18440 [Marinobacter sp. Arc7-DN-1]
MMKNCKYVRIHIIVISILLLIGQLSVLCHSAEHQFHAPDKSCQIFLQLEKSGNGLIFSDLRLMSLVKNIPLTPRITTLRIPFLQAMYFARAPPFSS